MHSLRERREADIVFFLAEESHNARGMSLLTPSKYFGGFNLFNQPAIDRNPISCFRLCKLTSSSQIIAV